MAAAFSERDLLPTALYVELEHLVTARNLLAHGGTSQMSAEDFRSLEATARRFFRWHFVESASRARMSAAAADALLTVPVLSDDPAARSRRVFICNATEDRRAADELLRSPSGARSRAMDGQNEACCQVRIGKLESNRRFAVPTPLSLACR